METFSTLVALCMGNSPVTSEFPSQRPVKWSFDVFFDLCLNKQLSTQSRSWWFETSSCPLWRHLMVHWHRPKPSHITCNFVGYFLFCPLSKYCICAFHLEKIDRYFTKMLLHGYCSYCPGIWSFSQVSAMETVWEVPHGNACLIDKALLLTLLIK